MILAHFYIKYKRYRYKRINDVQGALEEGKLVTIQPAPEVNHQGHSSCSMMVTDYETH